MRSFLIFTMALAGIATPALAQRGGDDWFAGADTNADGFVTRTEFLAYRDAQFTKLDRNRDGVISPADFPRLAKRKPEALDRLMEALGGADSNGDGAISRSELAQSPPMMFDRADADHDGRVTKAEYDAARARMRAAIQQKRN
jgi:Ca2+-binding EF-hand superfamily protein